MISNLSGAALPHLRPASASTSHATSGLQPVAAEATEAPDVPISSFRVNVSQVKLLQGAKLISVADVPVVRDLMAAHWLRNHDTGATQSVVSDDAPQNTYAQVKVDGKVVATVYNGGSSTMTNAAAGKIGKLEDPPGLG